MVRNTNRKSAQKALGETEKRLITAEIIGYADQMARGYRGCGLELEDLQQEARYGLCQAALHFDPKVGVTFKTFSTYYIKKYIVKALVEYGSIIRMGMEERAILRILSLDVELTTDGGTGADYLEDEGASSLAESLADEEAGEEEQQQDCEERVADLMKVLNKQERKAVSLIFGLEGTALTIRQTARVLKVQPERVRSIYNKAISKLEEAV